MRLQEYKKIKDLSNSLIEAVSYLCDTDNIQIREDCISAMDGIIALFEKNKKDIRSAEVINQATKIIDLLDDASSNKEYVQIHNLLLEFRDLCEEQIEKKYKLLFVADIRGKWDSVASVYKAVKEREDCDVDVVIQPIFRATKLADGSTRTEVIYEDYLTERGIAHIPYEKYKMEEELPDITFISQPYESVTVPMFWPENIAKYSKLVYLPYFTALTINSNISSALNSLIYMDIQKQAWKIACHSEVMENYYKNIGSAKGKNVIVSGLPKWDEVVNPDSRLTVCPEAWKNKISEKKVFIWNTHFTVGESASNILVRGFEFLNYFANRNDVALIWRPHPMTEVIIKTYMPEKYRDFLELQEIVEKSSNMVMDKNASYMPAFSCSDALITDFSSLLEQYLFTDKPILMLVKGSIEQGRRKYHTIDGLFDFSKIPFACTLEEQFEFVDSIVRGEDISREERKTLRETYFARADGNCGKRFAEAVLCQFEQEFFEQEKEIYLDEGNMLIVGALKESLPCVEQLKRNESKFYFCEEFLGSEKSDIYERVSLSDISDMNFQLIVITAKNHAEEIRNYLVDNLGLQRERIILFWKLYYAGVPLMVCDRVMQNPNNNNLDGLVLGISHTEVGIDVTRLKGKFCNLAVSSQDLWSQCKTLEHCVEKYYDKLKDLKYAIIDLYDYHYFNYNTSYSKSAANYLLYGGYNLEPHDFDNNKLTKMSFQSFVDRMEQEKMKGIIETDIQIWQGLFPDIYELAEYEGFCSNYPSLKERIRTVTSEEIRGYEYNRSTLSKLHKETITENVKAFQRMMQILKLINPEIKIYTVVIPKYIEVEALDASGLKAHEKYFYSVINDLQREYKFEHLDFKKISDISSHKNLYFDAAHLNYFGAMRLTDELNRIIFV